MLFKVLITDYVWPDIHLEKELLGAAGAEVILGDDPQLDAVVGQLDAIITCFSQVKVQMLRDAHKCKIVARYGIGLDNIPVETATELGMIVTNVPDYCIDEVSDHALAFILSLARRLPFHHCLVKDHQWAQGLDQPIIPLQASVLGLIGLGKIGRRLAQKAQVLGMEIIAYDPYAKEEDIKLVQLDQLLAKSDFVSVHCPLTPETKGIISHEQLKQMKKSAYLINVSRGEIVDGAALSQALDSGEIAGAGLDVLSEEPPLKDNPMLNTQNAFLSPHVAFYSPLSITNLRMGAINPVIAVLQGKEPNNIVNPEVLNKARLKEN